MKLFAFDKSTIKGKGDVYLIDLAVNNLPALRKKIKDKLLDKEVDIWYCNGLVTGKVKGIEMFATPETSQHETVGILI